MNIFFLSWDPQECAKLYCDQHVNKILLEIVQMLYTAWHLNAGGVPPDAPRKKNSTQVGYKPVSNTGHAMVMWVRCNPKFPAVLGMALAVEFQRRFKKVHSCTEHILWLYQNLPPRHREIRNPKATYALRGFPKGVSPVPECMPDQYKHPHLLAANYQYYAGDKLSFARWKTF